MLLDLVEDAAAGFGEAAPGEPRGEIIACLDQCRHRHPQRHFDHPVLDDAVVADDDDQGAAGRQGTNSTWRKGRSLTGRGDDAGVA